MRKLLFCFLAVFCLGQINAQESLISDIMNVDAVNRVEGENDQEEDERYQKELDDEKARLEDNLTKLGEDYQKDVTDLIEDFTKMLEEGEEKEVNNLKQSIVTQVTTSTMTLKKDKKKAIQDFENEVRIMIRELPKSLQSYREEELVTFLEEQRQNVETEFDANTNVVTTFKNTTHLTVTPKTAGPPASSDGGTE